MCSVLVKIIDPDYIRLLFFAFISSTRAENFETTAESCLCISPSAYMLPTVKNKSVKICFLQKPGYVSVNFSGESFLVNMFHLVKSFLCIGHGMVIVLYSSSVLL